MTNNTLDIGPAATQAQTRQIKGFSPDSVTVFTLGLFGFLIPILGIVPSVIALIKARAAKKQLFRARGNFRGYGLLKAGMIFAWLGILSTLFSIALAAVSVWALVNMPSLLPSLVGLSGVESNLNPSALLSILDTQDLKTLLSDPDILNDIEERLREAGLDPDTLFVDPATTPKP